MPIYRYKPARTPCRICGDGFEQRQAPADPELSECPTCGMAVTREAADKVNTPKASRKPSISEAKSAGFTVLKKTSDGGFEKQ